MDKEVSVDSVRCCPNIYLHKNVFSSFFATASLNLLFKTGGPSMRKLIPLILILFVSNSNVWAQGGETGGSGQSFFDKLMETAGQVLEEHAGDALDEWIGTYKGRITSVQLVERRGNGLILDVSYEKIKRSDGVYIQGEVLSGGMMLSGFTNDLVQVSGKKGVMRLTIQRSAAVAGQVDEWGLMAEPQEFDTLNSDQIRLSLVRETNQDRPFGSLTYNLHKQWTNSSELDLPPEAQEQADAVELAEGETMEETDGKTMKPFIPSGMVLAPVKTATPAVSGQAGTGVPTKQPTPTVSPIKVAPINITSHDFYKTAATALWRDSRHGKLTFGTKRLATQGYVRTRQTGTLNTGNSALEMLETQPPQAAKGWTEGRFPAMTLGNGVHFKAVAGFLKGSTNSDGATFRVIVDDGSRKISVIRHKIRANRYINLDADLSSWAGKKINIILRLESGPSSVHDYAVWVKPRLTTK